MKLLVHEWVTGGGLAGQPLPSGLASEGGAIRRALTADFAAVEGVEVVITLDARFAGEPSPGRIVIVEPGEEETALQTLARECDHTIVVAPETGGVLAHRTRLVERAGGSTLGCSVDAIATTGDKLLFAEHLTALGIAHPITARFVPPDALGYPRLYPAVVKPIDGAGSDQTYFLRNREDLATLPADTSECIIQAYQPGEPMSASFLVSENGEAHLIAVGWQRIANREARLFYLGGRLPGSPDRALGEPLSAVWSVPGLRGFVGVDYIWSDANQTAEVIEINPRVTTSYVGLARHFGPGVVAKAWLGVVGGNLRKDQVHELLSRPVCASVNFLPDGTIDE